MEPESELKGKLMGLSSDFGTVLVFGSYVEFYLSKLSVSNLCVI